MPCAHTQARQSGTDSTRRSGGRLWRGHRRNASLARPAAVHIAAMHATLGAAAVAAGGTSKAAAAGAAAAAVGQVPLAAVVPEFPRIGGQAVRDWIGAAVDQLPGFSGNDEARLLLPDLVQLVKVVDAPTLVIGGTLALAFIYWEGGVLLRQLQERRRRQRQQKRRQQRGGDGSSSSSSRAELDSWEDDGGGDAGSWDAGSAAAWVEDDSEDEDWLEEQQRRREGQPRPSRLERARHERRRGLGWLALLTATMVWLTGVVSGPRPFQP